MLEICEKTHCTGCGMCVDLCPHKAITMKETENHFLYPQIDQDKCIECGLCVKKCPINVLQPTNSTYKKIYAGWNKDCTIRKKSSSGGIFDLLAKSVLSSKGIVVGVRWTNSFDAEHFICDDIKDLPQIYGSKYIQSKTKDIYNKIKSALLDGKEVLFSGTPCQVAALNIFLGKNYDNLYTVDLVCHGVASCYSLHKFLHEINPTNKKIVNISLRHKAPHWDYCYVNIDFADGSKYKKLTVDDAFYTNFNIGYSLREGCHNCHYTTMHRNGDITLSDLWAYSPTSFRMRNYNFGVSMIMINSEKGFGLFEKIKNLLKYEEIDESMAKASNSSLTTASVYTPPKDKLTDFWKDYNDGLTTEELRKKYIPEPFCIPKFIMLKRLKRKYKWLLKK